jgi:thiol-disulfide isomerase/thioredoxin
MRFGRCVAASLVAAVWAGGAIAAVSRPRAAPLALETLASRRPASVFDGRPAVVLFWRADCAPCRLELNHLDALRAAASPLQLRLVGLQSADPLNAALRGVSLEPEASLRALAPPEQVLTAWGGAPPRLPLAVAINAHGRVCARHSGLIGTDRLRAWALACGAADARG